MEMKDVTVPVGTAGMTGGPIRVLCLAKIREHGKTLKFDVLDQICRVRSLIRVRDVFELPEALRVIQRLKPDLKYTPTVVEDSRRVTKAHVSDLFPETKTMPFPITCDYLKDRL